MPFLYSTATNQITALPGFSCPQNGCYDANGNTVTDSQHTYAWDADGKPITIDSVGLTYDAQGRMVEQDRSGSYTQIVYGLGGGKMALMNGQTLVKAFIKLPAGAVAVYGSGGTLSYFRHPDWVGSARVASDPNHNIISDLAYAPYGETYAESGTPDRSFTGQNQDTVSGSTTGLYDFMFRELAQYGRWISPDPLGRGAVHLSDPQSWNRYAYVSNRVTIVTDPLGLRPGGYYEASPACRDLMAYCGGGAPGGWIDTSAVDAASAYYQGIADAEIAANTTYEVTPYLNGEQVGDTVTTNSAGLWGAIFNAAGQIGSAMLMPPGDHVASLNPWSSENQILRSNYEAHKAIFEMASKFQDPFLIAQNVPGAIQMLQMIPIAQRNLDIDVIRAAGSLETAVKAYPEVMGQSLDTAMNILGSIRDQNNAQIDTLLQGALSAINESRQ